MPSPFDDDKRLIPAPLADMVEQSFESKSSELRISATAIINLFRPVNPQDIQLGNVTTTQIEHSKVMQDTFKKYLSQLDWVTRVVLEGDLSCHHGDLLSHLIQVIATLKNIKSLQLADAYLGLCNRITTVRDQIGSLLCSIQKIIPQLEELNLNGNLIGCLNKRSVHNLFVDLMSLPSLSTLYLHNNEMENLLLDDNEKLLKDVDDVYLKALFLTLIGHNIKLHTLGLANNKLGSWRSSHMSALVYAFQLSPHLRQLEIYHNELHKLSAGDLKALFDSLNHLVSLNVNSNRLGFCDMEQTQAIFDSLKKAENLRKLDFSGNRLDGWSVAHLEIFKSFLHESKLEDLNLRFSKMGEWEAEKIELFLKTMKQAPSTLTKLDLRGNEIEEKWDSKYYEQLLGILDDKNINYMMEFTSTGVISRVSSVSPELGAVVPLTAEGNTSSASSGLPKIPVVDLANGLEEMTIFNNKNQPQDQPKTPVPPTFKRVPTLIYPSRK